MGDRFYQSQLEALGTCPGYTGKRKKRMAWDEDKKAKAVSMYLEAGPTPENSMEVVKEIADELDESPNGVRMILTKAEVYIKKTPATGAKKPAASKSGEGTPRVSKEAAHESLIAAINDIGGKVDTDVISKLTGKAALYFAEVISSK